MKKIFNSLLLGFIATATSYLFGFFFHWIDNVDYLEAFAVLTSYSCTLLFVWETRNAYILGVITTAAYSLLFYKQGWYALSLFNFYLVFSLAYGWFRWGPDTNTRPISLIKWPWHLGYLIFGLLILGLFLGITELFSPDGISSLNPIDVILAALSGVAQLMLDNKKLENWLTWSIINIISIPFFLYGGLFVVTIQYIFFLTNSFYGHYTWRRLMKCTA